jgi:mRNA export factor
LIDIVVPLALFIVNCRLKGFNPIQRPIPCANFNASGSLFAYASSYDWSKGSQSHAPGTPNEIFIHYTLEDEIKPKGKKTGYKTR